LYLSFVLGNIITNQKMDKELQLCSVDAADEEVVPQQKPQRRKGGLVTMPFIIGIFL